MKVTVSWLKQYVDFNWTAEELTERLTMVGLEVEGVESIGHDFNGIVVAQILHSEQHPNADRLSVCKVNDGTGERQIVCGAKNFKVGDKVPLALPGASLPTPADAPPFVIKTGKLRGVESQGMMCSPKELQLSEESQGLMILPPDAPVGQPFLEFLGPDSSDLIYDLEVTPNRPDLNSVLGIAREISALTGNPLKWPTLPSPNTSGKIEDWVDVRIEDPSLCPRYIARVIRGVKIGPSPEWLRKALQKVGLRSINNVVDVTNYVMLEIGQPLHAFDYHLLKKAPHQERPTVVVRSALPKEHFTTLDGETHTLPNHALLIADEVQPIALAGIMGGANTEIQEDTQDVLLESACFHGPNIRATSKQLELRTDASYRFERGSDIGICDWASQRAAQLILETAGGTLVEGVVDAYPNPQPLKTLTLRYRKTNELLGIEISSDDQRNFLQSIDFKCSHHTPDEGSFLVPSFRVDVKGEIDLIEEITRLYGVDRIPSTPPRGCTGSNPFDLTHDELATSRNLLTAIGLFEAQGQTLILSSLAAKAFSPDLYPNHSVVALHNPLSQEMDVLRPSLLPGLLTSLSHNFHHQTSDVGLFEIGRIFLQTGETLLETRAIGLALTGQRTLPHWKTASTHQPVDLYDLKGLLEQYLENFGLQGFKYQKCPAPTHWFLESANLLLGKKVIGHLGQLQPGLAKSFDIKQPVYMAELNFDEIQRRRNPAKSYKRLPAFPSIRRDVALQILEETTHEQTLQAIKKANVPLLDSVEIIDVYRGSNLPDGHKSVTYALTYRHSDRTLTDAEVNPVHQKILDHLTQTLQAVLR